MIVLDASAVLEFLQQAERFPRIREVVLRPFSAPAILDFEIMNVLRRQIQLRQMTQSRADEAYDLYFGLQINRIDTRLIADRIWSLRNNFTSYDASYIALTELIGATLLTRDKKLVGKPGHEAKIEFVEPSD